MTGLEQFPAHSRHSINIKCLEEALCSKNIPDSVLGNKQGRERTSRSECKRHHLLPRWGQVTLLRDCFLEGNLRVRTEPGFSEMQAVVCEMGMYQVGSSWLIKGVLASGSMLGVLIRLQEFFTADKMCCPSVKLL